MAITDILTLTPEFNLEESIEFATRIDESEHGYESRDAMVDRGLREYVLTTRYITQAEMDTLWNFYKARQGPTDDFLMKIIHEFEIVDEPVGVGDGSTRTFLLHNFPVDTIANNSATVGGTTRTDYVLTNDTANEQSFITFNTAPALGDAVLVTYEFYMRLRFKEDRFSRQLLNHDILQSGITLKEVRWNTYFPIHGNSSSSSSSSSFNGTVTNRWYGLHGRSGNAFPESFGYSELNPDTIYHQTQHVRFIVSQVTTNMDIIRMFVYLDTAPGIGKKRVFTIYHNDQPTKFSISIQDLETEGDINGIISCRNGDYVYIREQIFNSPALTQVNIAYEINTSDAKRYPVLSRCLGKYFSLLDNYSIATGIFYATDKTLYQHSFFVAAGILRNLQLRYVQTIGIDSAGADNIEKISVRKKIGVDTIGLTDLSVQLEGMVIRGENTEDYVPVSSGDLIVMSEDTALAREVMVACDFVPSIPKISPHCGINWNNTNLGFSASADTFAAIHGSPINPQPIATRKEQFTYFGIAGKIKNLTVKYDPLTTLVNPTFPLRMTLRINGVDTNITFTLTNIISQVIWPNDIDIELKDKVSMKFHQYAGPSLGGSTNTLWIAWNFESQGAGQWPMFMNLNVV